MTVFPGSSVHTGPCPTPNCETRLGCEPSLKEINVHVGHETPPCVCWALGCPAGPASAPGSRIPVCLLRGAPWSASVREPTVVSGVEEEAWPLPPALFSADALPHGLLTNWHPVWGLGLQPFPRKSAFPGTPGVMVRGGCYRSGSAGPGSSRGASWREMPLRDPQRPSEGHCPPGGNLVLHPSAPGQCPPLGWPVEGGVGWAPRGLS